MFLLYSVINKYDINKNKTNYYNETMDKHSFIKDVKLLEENHRVDDLLGFDEKIEEFTAQLMDIENNSIVGFVGPYGCGKSTLLYQIHKDPKVIKNERVATEKLQKFQESKWFVFDAWKYPERKNLWEGLVLDIALQSGEKVFKSAINTIDGNKHKDKKVITKLAGDATSFISKGVLGVDIMPEFIKSALDDILSSEPLKRIYEFQELLLRIFQKIDQDIYIVIEDADRSGDKGIFLLETLRYLIKSDNSKSGEAGHKIVVIVPMGKEVFEEVDTTEGKKHRDTYLKILNFSIEFSNYNINFEKFIHQALNIEIINPLLENNADKEHVNVIESNIITQLQFLFQEMIIRIAGGRMRDVKYILRKADMEFARLKMYNKDIPIEAMLVIIFVAVDHLYSKSKKDKSNKYEMLSCEISPTDIKVKGLLANYESGIQMLIDAYAKGESVNSGRVSLIHMGYKASDATAEYGIHELPTLIKFNGSFYKTSKYFLNTSAKHHGMVELNSIYLELLSQIALYKSNYLE